MMTTAGMPNSYYTNARSQISTSTLADALAVELRLSTVWAENNTLMLKFAMENLAVKEWTVAMRDPAVMRVSPELFTKQWIRRNGPAAGDVSSSLDVPQPKQKPISKEIRGKVRRGGRRVNARCALIKTFAGGSAGGAAVGAALSSPGGAAVQEVALGSAGGTAVEAARNAVAKNPAQSGAENASDNPAVVV
jgi:hypothetical protein